MSPEFTRSESREQRIKKIISPVIDNHLESILKSLMQKDTV